MEKRRPKLCYADLTLAERMVVVRGRMKITQVELARRMGVSKKTVERMEAGAKVRSATVERWGIVEARAKDKGRA